MKRSTKFGRTALTIWFGGLITLTAFVAGTHMSHFTTTQWIYVFAAVILNYIVGMLQGRQDEAARNERAGARNDH